MVYNWYSGVLESFFLELNFDIVLILQKIFYKWMLFANHGMHEEHTRMNKTFPVHYRSSKQPQNHLHRDNISERNNYNAE